MRVTRTLHVRSPARAPAYLEIVYTDPPGVGRWRRGIAAWLMRLAARLARMRVRIVDSD